MSERLSGEEFRRLHARTIANIRLLELAPDADPVSFLWPSNADDSPANLGALEYAKRDSFDAWKSYVDEHIGFYYPDAPGIRVEVIGTTQTVPLFGHSMLPPESGVFRKYRITAGDEGTLCVISLARSDGYNDA
ncbi:MAG: hypothetical protein GY953_24630, partial [bacterium]|nr:hypothetical protein [bacterium]